MRTASEPSGENCSQGGALVETGIDVNRNGELEDEEVDASLTRYVCNGEQGPVGAVGPQGPEGPQGLRGEQGVPGPVGPQGEQGIQGDLGPVGPAGAVGPVGPAGPQGATGAEGPVGPAGDTGPQGEVGLGTVMRTTVEPASGNCATGGVRLETGVDANRNGTLDVGEETVALTRFVCNGPQGPQGAQGPAGAIGPAGEAGPAGPTGAQGPQGPQGATGSLGAYGDGSGGALTVANGSTLDLTTAAGYASLGGRHHLQFTTVTISGTLIVPSGTVIRATGDVTINGMVIVDPSAEDNGTGPAEAGVARAAAGEPQGGRGLLPLQAAQLLRPGGLGGGAGAKQANVSGGKGGGSLVILAQGALRVPPGGAINANGEAGGSAANLPGSGGGAGGVLVLVGKGSITVGGAVRAVGANGGAGNNAGGAGKGGGGGGAGGIIQLLSTTTPAVTGTIAVNAGAAGATANPTGASQAISAGGGGGACGGNGGSGGGGTLAVPQPSEAGAVGYDLRTVTPTPENVFL
ncbi:collagen-like protein [Myxococcus sp. AM010]|uniref:DUF7151 family protein n=1 Tax=unclassified Myxococcus TaxID=2648731 RepID=UPI0034CF3AAB